MRKALLLLFTFLLVAACAGPNLRDPASVKTSSCNKLIAGLLKKGKKSYAKSLNQKIIHPTLKKLEAFSLKARLRFLKMLNANRGRFKFSSELYASTINKMLTEELISIENIPPLLKNRSESKYILDFSYNEVRVLDRAAEKLPDLNATIDLILKRSSPSIYQAQSLRDLLSKLDLSKSELNEFQKYFLKYPKSKRQWSTLSEYMSFTSVMRSKNQAEAMREMPKLFSPKTSGKHLKSFKKVRKNIRSYQKKQFSKQERAAIKKGLSKKEAQKFASVEAKRMSEIYSGLKYSCRSTKPTAESIKAAKITSSFFMGMGITATAATYAYSNWDKDKSKFDWYGKLGHDLAWKYIFQHAYNKIMTDQAATFLKKVIALNAFYTPADYIEAAMYELEFGEKNAFIEEEYQRILQSRKDQDPGFVANYNAAMSSLNNEYFPEKLKGFMQKLLTGERKLPKDEFDEILSLNDISVGELEDEQLKERLLEAITQKVYNDNSGKVKFGSATMDRYIFVRSFDIVDVPKSLLVGFWIYKTMCMGGTNMKAALVQASIIYTIDQVLSKFIYYELRRDVINM